MIFPIGDDQINGGHRPIFSYSFIGINILVFLLEVSLAPTELNNFIITYGAIPIEIGRGQDLFTLFTNMFLHGGWMHLIGNMVFLWVFADNIEATIGNFNFLIFYILGGIIATLTHFAFNMNSVVPAVGASGAIAAVLGAYLVMFPKSKVKILVIYFFRSFMIPAFAFLGIWIVQQLFAGVGSMASTSETSGGTAWWAHIGGFAFGLIAGYLGKRTYLDPHSASSATRNTGNYF
ncbi:MAG: rhomboid family intramembrane serine protease [Bacteroidia bacterium]|nr:rhomboid family intramembrane serine protease [Bacteroidia bacterium]